MIHHLARALAPLALLAFAAPPCRAGDWPQWRGERRDGEAVGEKLPDPLPKDLKAIWRADVGEGYSSPAVVQGRVYLMTREKDEEGFIALDARTGERLWRYGYPLAFTVNSAAVSAGPGPKASVAVQDGRVYGLGIAETLTCVDAATGKVAWQHRFDKDFVPPWPETGASASPLVDGPRIVAQIGRENDGGLAAFDRLTGKPIWKTPGDGPSYAAPERFEIGGAPQIVSFTQAALVGVEPQAGKELWRLPFKTSYNQNIVSPILYKDSIIYTGLENGTARIALEPKDKSAPAAGMKPAELWRNKEHWAYMTAPVLYKDLVFFLSDKRKGSVVCLDAESGKTVWESPGRYADYASIIRVGATLLILTDSGELRAAPAERAGYRVVGEWRVAESQTWAHPVLAGGRLYIKDRQHLACFEF